MALWPRTIVSRTRSRASSIVVRATGWLAAASGLLLLACHLSEALDSWPIALIVAGVAALLTTSIAGRVSSRGLDARH